MEELKFSDKIKIDINGPLRILHLSGQFYVVGNGGVIPCKNRKEAEDTLIYEKAKLELKGA